MREQILRFLTAIDTALGPHAGEGERLDLYVIGKAALILFYGETSTVTSDVDVVQITHPPTPLLQQAIQMFGRDSSASAVHGLYLEGVYSGLPPLPGAFERRCRPFAKSEWRVLRVQQLDIHDLAASKLKRFAPKDRQDLRGLCDRGLLDPATLRGALESAYRWTTDKDGDEKRDGAFDHLRRVIAYLEGETREM